MKKVAILCVDDEMIILESLKQQLVKNFNNTYLYEYAQDGEEALEVIDYFLAEGVDLLLVISDYQMPGMQGDQFATVLKQRLPGINIVMLTGQMPADIRDELLDKNVVLKVISKPWNEADIVAVVKQLA
jgi:CheY-like chemotaxis protein